MKEKETQLGTFEEWKEQNKEEIEELLRNKYNELRIGTFKCKLCNKEEEEGVQYYPKVLILINDNYDKMMEFFLCKKCMILFEKKYSNWIKLGKPDSNNKLQVEFYSFDSEDGCGDTFIIKDDNLKSFNNELEKFLNCKLDSLYEN